MGRVANRMLRPEHSCRQIVPIKIYFDAEATIKTDLKSYASKISHAFKTGSVVVVWPSLLPNDLLD